jgi:nitrogenase molybdenum-cofactor synthesis protein NifE
VDHSKLLKEIGIEVRATITGDASYESIIKAPGAALNIVQCAGSMTYLANRMEQEMGIPFTKSVFSAWRHSASLIVLPKPVGHPRTSRAPERLPNARNKD